MDWPSRELSQRLAEWRLCTPQDVQRCRGAVRRFVRDLPAFDSVWIDALLQQRLLTPYQARLLDSAEPDRLCLAGHVITDCLEENAWRVVYRARPLEGGAHCLLTVHAVHPEDRVRTLEAMDETVVRLRGAAITGLNPPLRAEVGGRELIVTAEDVRGISLRELLVRRGRFPAAAVLSIARSLLSALGMLEDRGVPHGDLRARNVWLDDHGGVQLLHAGVLGALLPSFLLTQELPAEACDGIAPEVAGGAQPVNALSDQYALGCLLWQLVAGRPPFPTGDAQGKVSAHRTRSVPDVRDFAPQTPEPLAKVIERLTKRLPHERFSSTREALQQLGSPTSVDRRQLTRFFNRFETEAPTQTARETGERSKQWPSALAAVVISGATIWLFTSDPAAVRGRGQSTANSSSPQRLQVDPTAQPIPDSAASPENPILQTAGQRTAAAAVLPLPAPDASGVVALRPGSEYAAQPLKHAGPLVIRAAEGGLARIVIQTTPWELTADSIRFENVQLECHAPVRVQCRGLDFMHSVLIADGASNPTGIVWRPQDSAAASPGTITLVDSHFAGGGLACVSRPSFLRVANCLKTGAGALLEVPAAGRAHQTLPIHVIHTTLRDSGPLVAWSPGSRAAGQRLDVVTKACVFAPASGSPLLALAGSISPADWERSIGMSGLESLLRSGTSIVDLSPPPGKPRGAIDPAKLEVDGLMSAALEFFGPIADDVASSGLKSTDALFSVDRPPGIEVEKVARRWGRGPESADGTPPTRRLD